MANNCYPSTRRMKAELKGWYGLSDDTVAVIAKRRMTRRMYAVMQKAKKGVR